jgi:preprotein translocase subunit SecD
VTERICEAHCTPGQYKVVFRADDLDANRMSAGLDSNTQQPIVTFQFKGDAQKRFADSTGANVGKYRGVSEVEGEKAPSFMAGMNRPLPIDRHLF